MDVPIVSNSRSNCKQFCQNTTPFPACTAPGATVPKNQKCKSIDFLRVFCDNKHGSRLHCLRDGERFPHSEGRGRIRRFPEWSSCHGCNQCGHRPPIFNKKAARKGFLCSKKGIVTIGGGACIGRDVRSVSLPVVSLYIFSNTPYNNLKSKTKSSWQKLKVSVHSNYK